MTRLTHIIGYSAETSGPNEQPRWGHFTARWADEAQKNFDEWLAKHDAFIELRALDFGGDESESETEEDQRITAWHQIATPVACPHWSPGRITMRTGCTACAADAETENSYLRGEREHGRGNLT